MIPKYFAIIGVVLLSRSFAQDVHVLGALEVEGDVNFYQALSVSGDFQAAHITSLSGAGYSAFYGHQLGSTFANPEPIYAAVSDNGNGNANIFFSGRVGGPGGLETFSIRANGVIRSVALAGSGDRLLLASPDGSIIRSSVSLADLPVLSGPNVFKPYSFGSGYTEGIRINDAPNGYSLLHLGGGATSGAGQGEWTLAKTPAGNFEVRENGVTLVQMSAARFSSFVAGVFPRLVADSGSGIANYALSGAWTQASLITDSIEIVNREAATMDSSPTLTFHRYGSGGPQFRLDASGSNVLYLESSNVNSARSPLPYGGGSNAAFKRFHVDGGFSTSGTVSIGGGLPATSPSTPLIVTFDPTMTLNSLFFENRGASGPTGASNFALKAPYPYGDGVANNATRPMLDLIKLQDGNTVLATDTSGGSMGNVGIGNSVPVAKLDVDGGIRSSTWDKWDLFITWQTNDAGGVAAVYKDGVAVPHGNIGRGLNMWVFDRKGVLLSTSTYDVYGGTLSWNTWADAVSSYPDGVVIAVTSHDAIGMVPPSGAAFNMLTSVGASNVFRMTSNYRFGLSFAFIKGNYGVIEKFGEATTSRGGIMFSYHDLVCLSEGRYMVDQTDVYSQQKSISAGNAKFSGAVRIAPSGDLSMGSFTSGINPRSP